VLWAVVDGRNVPAIVRARTVVFPSLLLFFFFFCLVFFFFFVFLVFAARSALDLLADLLLSCIAGSLDRVLGFD